MEAYFDNSATTRCFEEVKDIVVKTMMEDFGNPSAMHQKGVDAEGYVKESARTLAQILKVTEKEILFTSGGTESNNLALIGGALANNLFFLESTLRSDKDTDRLSRLNLAEDFSGFFHSFGKFVRDQFYI